MSIGQQFARALTEQFYLWELRGRGWDVWPTPVQLEPPFRPFDGHFLPRQLTVDDGRIESVGSRFAQGLGRLLGFSKPPPPEPEPEEIEEPEAIEDVEGTDPVELQISLPPDYQPQANIFEQFLFSIGYANDRGHDYCARFIATLLDRVLTDLPADDRLPEIKTVPQPVFSDLFEHVALFEADALKPLSNRGWTCELGQPGDKYWKADQPGSVIEFEVTGQAVLIMDWHILGPMGQARVRLDEQPPVLREGWFDQTWGGYRQTTLLARDLDPSKHRVRIELLSEKNPQSSGHEFRILGLGAAGVRTGD